MPNQAARDPRFDTTLAGCRVMVLGTIAGFVPDAERVRAAIAATRPEVLALGVPKEDVTTLGHLATQGAAELVDPDPVTARFLEQLGTFGPTRVPSPDLEAAFAVATADGIPVEALDLDDDAHANVFTRKVGFMHVLRSNARTRRMVKRGLRDAPPDPYTFATAWDHELAATKAFRSVDGAREVWMAHRLRQVAQGKSTVLAIVPVARLAGIEAALKAPVTAPVAG